MYPQGAQIFPTQTIEALTAEINALNVCSELQQVVNAAFADLEAEIKTIEKQIEALLPIITIPTDLPSVIKWIENFIAPELKAYEQYAQQLVQFTQAIAQLTTAIENAAARLENCTISIPPISL